MPSQKPADHETIIVSLTPEMVTTTQKRAQVLGITVSEYIQSLLSEEFNDPWRQPLPPEVETQYEQDYQEFLEEERQGSG
jgi:hypothetical protein